MESLSNDTKDLKKLETPEMSESESCDEASTSQPNDEPDKKRAKLDENDAEVSKEKNAAATKPSEEDDAEHNELLLPTGNLRRFNRIPIFLVDYHNDVLEFIYRSLASRHLPLENNTLVHFDSHPDMVISREIPASASFDKEAMLADLSIENWIMPTCYAGHFNRVIWVKNSWCKQMPVGKYNFKIGHKDDTICVSCCMDYFISEGNYCPSSELENARDMELHVVNADTEIKPNPKELLSAADASSYVLDIDLDFFSTSNPFLEIYEDANIYMQLTEIFQFKSVTEENVLEATEKRKAQLEALKRIFEHLEEKRNFEGLERPPIDVVSQEVFEKIERLADSLLSAYGDDEIDWLLIFDSGNTTDTKGLPHHISTEDDLNLYYSQFKEFLTKLPNPPILITMACSAEDDYCPRNQVTSIQEKVVEILKEVFGDKVHEKPILQYLDEEWDIMTL